MADNLYVLPETEDDLSIPNKSIGYYLLECLKKRNPNDIIFEDALTHDTISAKCLLVNSIKLVSVFKKLGVEKDDVICMMIENNVNYASVVLAALYAGIIVNPINPDYTEGEIRRIFEITRPKMVISSETALAVLKKFDTIQTVLYTSKNGHNLPNLEQLIKDVEIDLYSFEPIEVDTSSQLTLILLSSGTTGLPKGVLYTHKNVRAAIICLKSMHLDTKWTCTIQYMPGFHVYGIMMMLGAIFNQTKLVIMRKFETHLFLKCIEQHRIETIFGVPQILQFLCTTPLLTNYDITSIKYIFTGTASISENTIKSLKQRLKEVTILQLYGLTETSGPCVYQRPSKIKLGSVGNLVPGCTAKIVSVDNQQAVGPYKVGEICFKGDCVMKGYFNNEEATRMSFDSDGFFHTGDLGYYDDTSCFYIVDRLKDIIKYKGFQVSPSELENVLLEHPCIKETAVVGIPDERAGEVPLAFVVFHKGMSASEKEVIEFVAERISVQKRLYGGVRILENIPKTSLGKIQRRALLHLYTT
ncbi:hypothetical protein FQR65_LT07610 [Abscondita terminalis]|nr:hypothetical protein FQR65_LT07610 [Abscondita terminalis]